MNETVRKGCVRVGEVAKACVCVCVFVRASGRKSVSGGGRDRNRDLGEATERFPGQ